MLVSTHSLLGVGALQIFPNFPAPGSREDQILAHALSLVRESGLAGLTMRKVAERVGFTETAAYRYFPTKQALIHGLMERMKGIFLGRIRAIAEDASLSREERLERVVRHHLDLIVRTDGLPVLLLAEAAAGGDREALARIRSVLDTYLGILESLLPPGETGPEHVGPREKALLLFSMPAVVAIRRRLGDTEAESAIARLLPFVIRCVANGPERSSQGGKS